MIMRHDFCFERLYEKYFCYFLGWKILADLLTKGLKLPLRKDKKTTNVNSMGKFSAN